MMRTTIEMAREAAGDDWGLFQEYMPEIHRLAELVRADERARMATDKSKEVMKLALEALEHMLEDAKQERLTVEYWNECVDAITALREALAEQPAQRTWVWLSEEEKQEWIDAMPYNIEPRHCMILLNVMEVQLKQRNT